jgi:lysophospholipase L1-like esterase
MKVVVCFGDSNTWGYKPEKVQPELRYARFDYNIRWTGCLQKLLGDGYRVEEEGLNGRTTTFDDPFDDRRNGLRYFDCCMAVKMPVDLLIVMLGSNDTKEYFGVSAYCIGMGLEQLILRAQSGQYGPDGKNPKILIIAPPLIRSNIADTWPAGEFGRGCIEKAEALADQYEKVAKKYDCYYLNAANFVAASGDDAVHLDAQNHKKFAEVLSKKIPEMFVII